MKNLLLSGGLVAFMIVLGAVATAGERDTTTDHNVDLVTSQQSVAISGAGDVDNKTPIGFFKKKTWLCKCLLISDKDGTDAGTWQGKVKARTRMGAEKIGANRVCEEETALKLVNCKKCSCGKI